MSTHINLAHTTLIVRRLGRRSYEETWRAMRAFTTNRNENTPDECWLLEHEAVFTQGQNGKPEHILNPGNIPVVQTDRGGQVTYHGPGQLMLYTLIDIKRKKLYVRDFVTALEQTIIALLHEYHINAYTKQKAPGVYVESFEHNQVSEKKIASIGLRIHKGCSYHGIAFNVNMDLEPFARINPCGFEKLRMTQFSSIGGLQNLDETADKLINYFTQKLGYTSAKYLDVEFCG